MERRDGTALNSLSDWLVYHGWFEERDIGCEADELISIRMRDAERQGEVLEPSPIACQLIRSYGSLSLRHPTDPECSWEMDPLLRYEGDAECINELGRALGVRLFPIGYEQPDLMMILVDNAGRFFGLHSSGGYFLGGDSIEAFQRFWDNVRPMELDEFLSNPIPAVSASLLIDGNIFSHTNVIGPGEPNIHPLIWELVDKFPAELRSCFDPRCAEVVLLSDQLWGVESRGEGVPATLEIALVRLAGSVLMVQKIREQGHPEHGQSVMPDEPCMALLNALGVRVVF